MDVKRITHAEFMDTRRSVGDTKALISNGIQISCIVDKKTVGKSAGVFVHMTRK